MKVVYISLSISIKVWDQARIKLMTPDSAISVATDCAKGSGTLIHSAYMQKPSLKAQADMPSKFLS